MRGLRIQRITSLDVRKFLLEHLDEFLGDGVLHVDSAVGHADLPAVELNAVLRLIDRVVEVAIVEYYGGGFAAQFEHDVLQVGFCARGLDKSARAAGAREAEGAHVMCEERIAPDVCPCPEMTFITPGGKLTFSINVATLAGLEKYSSARPVASIGSGPETRAFGQPTGWVEAGLTVNGAFSLLLSTTVFPAASAGATLFAKNTSGTFQGMIAATTPYGCLNVMSQTRRIQTTNALRLEAGFRICSNVLAAACASKYCEIGRPIDWASRRARSSLLS